MKFFILLCLSTFFISQAAYAEFTAHRIQTKSDAIHIDGKLNDAVWEKITSHNLFYQTQPLDKVKAHVKTEVKIAHDEKFLYVGIKSFDPEAHLIRSPFARRDKFSNDQDYVGLFIDPSSAHKSAQYFYVNARGAISDGVYADTSGEDGAPDYDFEVVTDIQDDGWSAEYRIPFSSIAYDKESSTPWSLLVIRNMTRDQRYRMYSGQVTRATSCNLCSSNTIEGMKDLPSTSSWHITPQLVARQTSDNGTGEKIRKTSTDLSMDFKFRPNSSTTIDATINPDFSQIELDSPQLSGNTKFSIFVQEKRPFFLEGADIFRTQMNVISTRSISNPDVGIRYTNRDAEKDFSVLAAKDVHGGLVMIPNAYYTGYATRSVVSIATDARANYRFGSLSIGGVLTDRTLMESRGYNRVIGPDFIWQVNPNQVMRGQFLTSTTTAHADANGNLVRGMLRTGHAAAIDWSRGTDQWAISMNMRDISKDFRADNGFFPQVGFKGASIDGFKKYRSIGIFNELNIGVHGDYRFDSEGKKMLQRWATSIRVNGAYDSQAFINIQPNSQNRVKNEGELFTTSKVTMGVNLSPSKQITRIGVEYSMGDVIDVAADRKGKGGSFNVQAKLRPFDRFELEANLASSWIDAKQSDALSMRAYKEAAFQLNSILHLSAKDTLRLIMQESKTKRNPLLYVQVVTPESTRSVRSLVYSHIASLGTAAYIGITSTDTDHLGASLKRDQNEIFVKFSKRW